MPEAFSAMTTPARNLGTSIGHTCGPGIPYLCVGAVHSEGTRRHVDNHRVVLFPNPGRACLAALLHQNRILLFRINCARSGPTGSLVIG
jgi:hypothetical protein